MIKIVTISDTHNFTDKEIKIPNGDILIHAGDFSDLGTVAEVNKFLNWFSQQPHEYKIFIAGNHDWLAYEDPALFKAIVEGFPDVIYLQDSGTKIKNLNIWGTPWQLEFCQWAFNKTEEELIKYYNLIPSNTDIIICHGPPYNCGAGMTQRGEDVGSKSLLEAIKRVKPKLIVCGHIHYAYGIYAKYKTLLINASICTEFYKPDKLPIVINI